MSRLKVDEITDLAGGAVELPGFEGGGSGGSGADAWGNVAGDGELRGGLNCTIEKINLAYRIRFNTPMPNNRYAVTFGSNNTNSQGKVVAQGATFMDVQMVDVATDTALDRPFYFAVFATNALPPTGGTGTDAWGLFNGTNANIDASFNIASVTRNNVGEYTVVFTNPMPSPSFAVNATPIASVPANAQITSTSITGFTVAVNNAGSNLDPSYLSFSVNATNATLPATLTQDMVVMKSGDNMTGDLTLGTDNITFNANSGGAVFKGNIISQTSVFAYCTVSAVGANAVGGYNITAARNGSNVGQYDCTFISPPSTDNYVVVATAEAQYNICWITNKTNSGFRLVARDLSELFDDVPGTPSTTNANINLIVFANNNVRGNT